MDLSGTLVEGWNVGWDGDWIANGDKFSFTKSYPDYDLPAVAAYAKSKGVGLIVHNETAMGIENYERQLDSAFALYQRLGVHCDQDRLRHRQDARGPSRTPASTWCGTIARSSRRPRSTGSRSTCTSPFTTPASAAPGRTC